MTPKPSIHVPWLLAALALAAAGDESIDLATLELLTRAILEATLRLDAIEAGHC